MTPALHLSNEPPGVARGVIALLFSALLVLLGGASAAHSAVTTVIERGADSYDRAGLVDPAAAAKVKQARNLAGAAGWFDFDVNIPAAGWYELVVFGHAISVETLIDPAGNDPARARYYVPASTGFNGKDDKIGNFWLPAGKHVVRLQRFYWTGFPNITGFSLRGSDGRLATSVRVTNSSAHWVHRKGECGQLAIEYGPRATDGALPIHWVNAATSTGIKSYEVALPATRQHTRLDWRIPCDDEGTFVLYVNGGKEPITNRDVHHYSYEVIDTGSTPKGAAPQTKTLVEEIDLAATEPDYRSGNTRVVRNGVGAYRESDDKGWFNYQRGVLKMSQPSWFAYVLKRVAPQQPYLVEVDYPDDAQRTFAIALRESNPLSYPVAGGVDSGGEFALTHRMQTHTLLYWPRARETRLTFLPAHDGRPAAAARIRVYRIEGPLPPLLASEKGGRSFANWYEEGTNFLSMYGARDESPTGTREALTRWAQALRYMGADTMWPTVLVYSFALYPSVWNRSFSQPSSQDLLRQALLVAEKHQLKVVPEVHPRADELGWPHAAAPEPKPHLLASRSGQNRKDLPPFFNPLHTGNQDWYVGMIGELADRYRDSPALSGVSLRFMQWKNPTLHNFHSLEWGYDDLTIAMFEKETGIRIPVAGDAAGRHASRHRWLMANARERWIDWRCAKIAQLLTRIRDRVRKARPDLVIYIPVYATTETGSSYNTGPAWLREAGLDVRLLSKIDGVVLVNGLHTYGRRADDKTNALLRSFLTDRASLHALSGGKQAAFLPTASYFEATEAIAPPAQLGFPESTKKTWMSAVVNPAGRSYLERYAIALAETDAKLLGDGGNAYTLGQPPLREFLAEYRRLPPAPFTPRADARDPVAVWELARQGEYVFYAVNRSPREATVEIRLTGGGSVSRLATGESVATDGGTLHIALAPFQLLAYKASGERRIAEIRVR